MERTEILEIIGEKMAICKPVGSRVTCSPPPTDTDEDWLVLCSSNAFERLERAGFHQEGTPEFYTGNDAGGFRSWRNGDINVITTQDGNFYNKFSTATHLAQRFNLLEKRDRIALFQAILYGVDEDNLQAGPIS